MVWRIAAVALSMILLGCSATVTHQRESAKATGIRYYDSAPYLLVYSDGMNGLKWQIIYLPDQTHVMVADPTILGGRTELTLNFENGVLTTASTVGNTTALAQALIAAVQTALPLLGILGYDGAPPKPPGFPPPYLYRLEVKGNVISFKGPQGKGDTNIQVPIKTGPAS